MSIIPRYVTFFLLLVTSVFASLPAHANEVIRINGTGSGLVLIKPLIASYQKAHPGVSIQVGKSLGSSASIKALAKDAIDLSLSGRPLNPKEAAQNLVESEYGKTPFAVVTHKKSKVGNLSLKELTAIYSGTVGTWPNGDFVRLVLRPNDDVDTKLVRAISPEMDKGVTAAHARSELLLAVTDQDAFETIKRTQGSLGFIALVMPLSEPGAVQVAKVNGVEPTLANLASHRYPYAKTIYLITRKDSSPATRKFLEFLRSKRGEALARKAGLLPEPH